MVIKFQFSLLGAYVYVSETTSDTHPFLSRLLFLATLIFHGHTYRLWRQEHKTSSVDNATVEMKAQGTPMLAPQSQPVPGAPQYTDQQQYQSHVYPQSQEQHDPSAYAPQGPYPGFNEHQQQQQSQPYGVYPDPNQYHSR